MTSFKIGDKVYMGNYERKEKRIPCPDCLGNRYLTVIMGDGTHIQIDCVGCSSGFDAPTGTILQYDFEAGYSMHEVTGIKITKDSFEYELDNHNGTAWRIGKLEEVFATSKEALLFCEAKREEHESEQNKRFLAKTKAYRSWSWNAHYHLSCARKAEKDADYHHKKARICLAQTD